MALAAIMFAAALHAQEGDEPPFQEKKFTKAIYTGSGQLEQQYSFIGCYREALWYVDDGSYIYPVDTTASFRRVGFDSFLPKVLKTQKLITLNEAHCFPQDRITLYNMLDALKATGFTTIFMEALTNGDSAIRHYGYPTVSSGNYIREIAFSEVIRKCISKGIDVVPYEDPFLKMEVRKLRGKEYIVCPEHPAWVPVLADAFMIDCMADFNRKRDLCQAIYIYEYAIQHKLRRVFIYCGAGHGFKAHGAPMAQMVAHLLGSKLYAIDQTCLSEHSDSRFENPYYTRYCAGTGRFVLLDRTGQPYHTFPRGSIPDDSMVDLLIGRPRTVYRNERPDWLELNGERKRIPLNKLTDGQDLKGDFLVKIFIASEYDKLKLEAVPFDIFQVEGYPKAYDALLKPHQSYKMLVVQDAGVIFEKDIGPAIIGD